MAHYNVTNEQIKKCYDNPELLKELFPNAFKLNLEAGKWYCIDDVYSLFCITSIKNNIVYGYGFNRGEYFNYSNEKGAYCACNSVSIKRARPAKAEEVETALIAEAKKRGYENGNHICLYNNSRLETDNIYSYNATYNLLNLGSKCASVVFVDGQWAEIIKQTEIELTLDEIAEKFGVDKVKIKK